MKKILFSFFLIVCFCFSARATWCVAGNSNRGALTPSASQTTTVSFNPNGLVPYWSFAGTAGVTYHFSLCASANTEDAVLNIYDGASPGGNLVAANDEGSCPSKSSLTFICPANGTYYVAANLYPWFSFATTGGLRLTNYICAATAGTALPFTENWTTSDVTTACSSWMAHGAGGEGDWYTGNPIIPGNPNCAGGTGNEAGFVGNQANLYGVGVTKTLTLTSPKLNTTSVTSMTFAWKQSLGVTNSGASGSNNIIIKLQSSSDLITWTDRYVSPTYVATATLTTPVWQANQSVTFNPSANDTWLRFTLTAVPFKVWGFFVDNGGITIMPVEMLSFSGKNTDGKTTLNWETASETNNDYFLIERSEDAQVWDAIEVVKGAGTTSTSRKYEFSESAVLKKQNPEASLFYRLKQVDFDGKFEYYGPISVAVETENDWQLIMKNIVDDENMFCNLLAKENSEARINILDIQGRIIWNEKINVLKGATPLHVDLSAVESGACFIKIYNEKIFVIRKFIKM